MATATTTGSHRDRMGAAAEDRRFRLDSPEREDA